MQTIQASEDEQVSGIRFIQQRRESYVDRGVGEDQITEEVEANFGARYIQKKKKKKKKKAISGDHNTGEKHVEQDEILRDTRYAQRRESYIDKAVGDDEIDVNEKNVANNLSLWQKKSYVDMGVGEDHIDVEA